MESNKILQSDFLDILFDDRNKGYGAYELRRSYDKRIVKALCITGIAIGLIVGSTLMARPANEDHVKPDDNEGVLIRVIEEQVEAIEPPPPPPPPPPVEPPQIKMIDFMTPEIVDNEQVTKTPPEQADFNGAQIGNMDRIGIETDISVPPPTINKIQIIPEKEIDPNETWVGPVELEAEFPGGAKEWERFLRRNLQPDIPVDNNAAPGRYTVYLQFIVDKEGKVSDIKALTAHGFGMEEEAIRVLRKATTWHPANQNGRAVKAYRKQPITFVVKDE